ncbi:hypothetical protein A9K65_014060 [Mesorhizobium sp. WSM1497]|nr:hypothetical protein A9K65_014060 [Mesorhizobium sp. WSM1497]
MIPVAARHGTADESSAGAMNSYRVEEIENDVVQATHQVDALTPFQAAAKAVHRAITLRSGEANWIRVTQVAMRSGRNKRRDTVFEYRAIGPRRR